MKNKCKNSSKNRIKGYARLVGYKIGICARITDETNLQSGRYILRSSEKYLLRDTNENVICFVP